MSTDDDHLVDGRRPPAGHHWQWKPDPTWRVIAGDAAIRPCRYGASPGHPACGQVGVAEMNRRRHSRRGPTTDSWWAYCGRHLYGRRIVDGVVQHRYAVPDEPEAGH